MKAIQNNKQNDEFNYYIIEPGDIKDVNIGGILCVPKGELKTKKLFTMISKDKYQSERDKEHTYEEVIGKSLEEIEANDILSGLGLKGQITLVPLLPSKDRVADTLENPSKAFDTIHLIRECFTELDEQNPYYRLDEQMAKMMKYVIEKYDLDEKVNMFGHSGQGLPILRFAMLQPEIIDNLVCGGDADEIPTPVGQNAFKLGFPFGTLDYIYLFGKEFNEKAFRDIHFRFYVGEYEHVCPQLDGIRDCNYTIRENGKKGTGMDFAPEEVADIYKTFYNPSYRKDVQTGLYERLRICFKRI